MKVEKGDLVDVYRRDQPNTTLCVRCGLVKCYLPCNVCTRCLFEDPDLREGEV